MLVRLEISMTSLLSKAKTDRKKVEIMAIHPQDFLSYSWNLCISESPNANGGATHWRRWSNSWSLYTWSFGQCANYHPGKHVESGHTWWMLDHWIQSINFFLVHYLEFERNPSNNLKVNLIIFDMKLAANCTVQHDGLLQYKFDVRFGDHQKWVEFLKLVKNRALYAI
jgi:hypothetical protein